jgi:hypothetical protein
MHKMLTNQVIILIEKSKYQAINANHILIFFNYLTFLQSQTYLCGEESNQIKDDVSLEYAFRVKNGNIFKIRNKT